MSDHRGGVRDRQRDRYRGNGLNHSDAVVEVMRVYVYVCDAAVEDRRYCSAVGY